MSTVRMTPELIATMQEGVVFRIVKGGAPMGAKVTAVRLEPVEDYVEGSPVTIAVDVDDGIEGDRLIHFERLYDREED